MFYVNNINKKLFNHGAATQSMGFSSTALRELAEKG
jgi:hypothetical protein